MNDPVMFTNKIYVKSVAEAMGRVVVAYADYVFYCESEDCYINIKTDAYGNKSYIVYKTKPQESSIENRIKKLEDAVFGQGTDGYACENNATSTDSKESSADVKRDGSKEPISCSGNTEDVVNRE